MVRDFKDYQYIVDDLVRALGQEELSTYEIAMKVHMAVAEVWDWMWDMEKAEMVQRRYFGERWHWKRVRS
jgi:predicted Rossmann fold nucleotide-binding protein DprA/Smf involved in DNA uptake